MRNEILIVFRLLFLVLVGVNVNVIKQQNITHLTQRKRVILLETLFKPGSMKKESQNWI